MNNELLAQENEYHIVTERIAQKFGVDAFCVVWGLSKDTLYNVLSHYFFTTSAILQQTKALEDVLHFPKSMEPKLFLFQHLSNDGTWLPVKKIAKVCRERGLISLLDVTESVAHIEPLLFPCDMVVCHKKTTSILILNEHFVQNPHGLWLKNMLMKEVALNNLKSK